MYTNTGFSVDSMTAKYLAALEDRHREVFERLPLPFPKVKDLESGQL
jgi:hypothetical protein